MIVDELRSLQERAHGVEGHRATRLAEVHERIVRARRRRVGILGTAVAALVVGAAAVARVPSTEDAVPPADRVPPPSTSVSNTSGVPAVGYPALPPADATPSRPGTAELVLHYRGAGTSGGWAEAWVWADGRFIAEWHEITSSAPGPHSTGYVERWLSASGVEALTAYALDPGHPAPRSGAPPFYALLKARQGDRLVRLWPNSLYPDRILGPESWLPETAWVDKTPRPYVPSRFAVCLGGGTVARPLATAEVRASLPDSVAGRLDALESFADDLHASCALVSTAAARSMAAELDHAWLERDDHRPFTVDVVFVRRESSSLRVDDPEAGHVGFYPILPDGRFTCTNCG